MSARTFSKPAIGRTYLYYVCVASAHHKREKTRIQDAVSRVLKAPSICVPALTTQSNRSGACGDPATESERWLEETSEVAHKRARCQEMTAERLVDFEELRARLAALEDTRKPVERELHALQHRIECLAQLKRDRDSLLESCTGVLPEAIDALEPEERRRVYRMSGTEAHLGLTARSSAAETS